MHFKERISRENGLRYINLEGGSAGIICNGAGYAMASMDLLTLYGGKPANFMDLGGQAYHEKATAALILMQKDEEVDAIFINTYSGIVPADKISVVVREAVQKGWVTKPIVCRLKGSFAEGATKMLRELDCPTVYVIDDLDAAARKVVELSEREGERKRLAL